MILADKIIDERKKNGWSQEELAEKLNVSRQAVSKWESAGSVPDLNNIMLMSEIFGVSTDYLLKDDAKPETNNVDDGSKLTQREVLRKVSMEEANEFLELKRKSSSKVANGVSLCILSPIILLILAGLSNSHLRIVSEKIAVGFGVACILLIAGIAVFVFVTNGLKLNKYEFLEKEPFETQYGVSGMVKEKRTEYEVIFTRLISIGIVLCVLSAIPVIIGPLFYNGGFKAAVCVSLLLLIVAIGVNMIVRGCIVKGSFDMLLQEGEYNIKEKEAKKKLDVFSGVYWAIVVAAYLACSFITRKWDTTWIIWPVAAVLYAAISGIAKSIIMKK